MTCTFHTVNLSSMQRHQSLTTAKLLYFLETSSNVSKMFLAQKIAILQQTAAHFTEYHGCSKFQFCH